MIDDPLYGNLPESILTDDYIDIPGLPLPMPRDHAAWTDWSVQMLLHREKVATACASDPEERTLQRALCRQPHGLGAAYFCITFGWIYEPRDDDDYAMAPFILFPRQAEFLFALEAAMRRPKGADSSMAVPKARGVGATWMDAVDHIHRWLFLKNYQGRLASRNEDMVDKKGSSDAWMWKFDYILDRLPFWLLPEGYSSNSRYRSHMTILNPLTGAAIMGEATTSGVGVGGRATKYSLDEGARWKNLAAIWGQLSETTNHRVILSTHNIEVNTDFWDMVHGINGWVEVPVIFEMPWDCVPFRDAEWLESTRRTMRADIFQREILMNPWAGLSGWVYPLAKQKVPAYHPYRPDRGQILHGLDDGYDDDFAIIWAQRDRGSNKLIVLDGYRSSHQPIKYYGNLLKGELPGRYEWDIEARRIARWVLENRTWNGLFAGDRHGANTEITSGTSAWNVLLTDFGIHVMPNPPTLNSYHDRRNALTDILPDIDFADTPGAMQVLQAVQQNKYPERRGSAQSTNETARPVHDQSSHFTTALEYIAAYIAFTSGAYADDGKTQASSARNDFMQPRGATLGRRRSPERTEFEWSLA